MNDLEKEIKQLKRSVAQLRFILVAVSVVLVGCCAASRRATTVHAGLAPATVPDVITAKEFVVVDANGNQIAVLGTFPDTIKRYGLVSNSQVTGLGIYASRGANSALVATFGLDLPGPSASGGEAQHSTGLVLQSDDGTTSNASLLSFSGNSGSQERLSTTSAGSQESEQILLSVIDRYSTIEAFLKPGPAAAPSTSTITASPDYKTVGLQNCFPPSPCTPIH